MSGRTEKLRNTMRSREIDAVVVTAWENIYYLTGLNFAMFDGQPAVISTQSETSFVYPSFWWIPPPKTQTGILASSYDFHNSPVKSKLDLAHAIAERCHGAHRVGLEFNRISALLHSQLSAELQGSEFVDVTSDFASLRMVKDMAELKNIRKASKICETAMSIVERRARPGITEKELIEIVDKAMRENGSDGLAFPTMIASGKNSLDPCWTGSSRKIGHTDLVYVDVGPMVNGYASDMTRTFFIGRVSKEVRDLYRAIHSALSECHEKGKSGMPGRELDSVARDYLAKQGYGKYFLHPAGHGVGMTVGEEPMLAPWSDTRLKEGMTFTLEIGAYVPNVGGVRLEDTVCCKADRLESLTRYPCDQLPEGDM